MCNELSNRRGGNVVKSQLKCEGIDCKFDSNTFGNEFFPTSDLRYKFSSIALLFDRESQL